jgi:5-methylcytosine-specific restriction endonuclease McrA
MKLTFCVACNEREELQHHHLIPRAEGGSDEPSNLITLCFGCYVKLRGRPKRLAVGETS